MMSENTRKEQERLLQEEQAKLAQVQAKSHAMMKSFSQHEQQLQQERQAETEAQKDAAAQKLEAIKNKIEMIQQRGAVAAALVAGKHQHQNSSSFMSAYHQHHQQHQPSSGFTSSALLGLPSAISATSNSNQEQRELPPRFDER